MTTASLRTVYPGTPTLPSTANGAGWGFDPRQLRREFPIFTNNPNLVFLDSGASAQKPSSVIDRIADYYRTDYANVHRGVYRLSARSTELFEEAREKVRRFLNAADIREIVFVRGATEGINLVAQSWGSAFLEPGDEVLISELEPYELSRASMVGQDIFFPPRLALMMALLVHELATNAAKYGALSITVGKLSIFWSVSDSTLSLARTSSLLLVSCVDNGDSA